MQTNHQMKVSGEVPVHKWWVMCGVGGGILMATLDSSIVNIALPTLIDQLHTDLATVQWVVLSYILVLTSTMLGAARLGDMYGKKKLYLLGLAIFTVSSLLCGLAPSVGWLILARALQGLGGSLMQALGIAIVTEAFPPLERGRAMGIVGSIVSVGIAMGPPLGGLLIGMVSWHAVFLVNVPVGILTWFVVVQNVPLTAARPGQKFDLPGALLLLFTLTCYGLGMTLGQNVGFGVGQVVALLLAAAGGLGAFFLLEAQLAQPMVDLRLFHNLLFSLNLLMGFLVFSVLSGTFIIPFFLQFVKGYTIQEVGFLLMAMPLSMGLISPWAGTLSDHYGPRAISLLGLSCLVCGCLGLGFLDPKMAGLDFVLRVIPMGVGFGLFQASNNSAIMSAAPRESLGVASGLLQLMRTLGQTSGLPLMGALFTGVTQYSMTATENKSDITKASAFALTQGVNGTFRVAAFVILGSTILAAIALWLDSRQQKAAKTAQALGN